MQYLEKSFSVNVGGKAYSDGWERIFGPKSRPISDIRRQVEEFHHAMGQPVLDTPQVPSRDRVLLRLRLILEEFRELTQALFGYTPTDGEPFESHPLNINLVEVADALADLDYVIEGARLEFGINGAPIANEVHRSNCSKLGSDGKPVIREDGKITKGPNYSPPDIARCLREQGWQG